MIMQGLSSLFGTEGEMMILTLITESHHQMLWSLIGRSLSVKIQASRTLVAQPVTTKVATLEDPIQLSSYTKIIHANRDISRYSCCFRDGSSRMLADIVNSQKAHTRHDQHDYILYLCSASYSDNSISRVPGKKTVCPKPKPSILDLNLPSITIPNLREEVTLIRTVNNVRPLNSIYKVVIDKPYSTNETSV
ncbi:unnamed protein product [Thlaspi arvense]|uniref:Subtilisin-like protease fibronectin type-III domain-containing protein n=1 Tax=Thlaspi arvense TaxID=13288 RepID=A0AAU9SRT1_THLAR|nr:unnamed protein product [Thlaspi arvense]